MIATLIVGYLSWWGVVNAVEFDLMRSLGPFYHYLALGPLAVLSRVGSSSKCAWTTARSPFSRDSRSCGPYP